MITETTRHLTASALVFDPHQRTVLLIHHKADGMWQFPGGHVNRNEAADEAAAREVEEETGVRVIHAGPVVYAVEGVQARPVPIASYEVPAPAKPHKGEPPHSHLDLLYSMRPHQDGIGTPGGKLTGPADEVTSVRWVPVTELKTMPGLRPYVLKMAEVFLPRMWGQQL